MKKSKIIVEGYKKSNSANSIFPFVLNKMELDSIRGGETCSVLKECKIPPGKSVCRGGYATVCVLFSCSGKLKFTLAEHC